MKRSVQAAHWDIFCVVVDNYGDIGVTWRLAKQLSAEYGLNIKLWVDDLQSFTHILPELNAELLSQEFHNVTILKWNTPLDNAYIAGSVVIEAFACELPSAVHQELIRLHQSKVDHAPLWLNLEYLSAEAWVAGCHGLPSLQASGLKKFFYFPGFSDETGGLICEQSLLNQRQNWQNDSSNKMALFSQLGLTGIEAADKVISVFSYETEALTELCNHWAKGNQKVHALIPKGRSLNSLAQLLPCAAKDTQPGQQFLHGSLTLHILPMTDQQGYDHLLWSCDFNIVRGEDSFLRAQWAARPFIWHIYPQEEDYHIEKLEAFMALYANELTSEASSIWSKLNLAFNLEHHIEVTQAWQDLRNITPTLLQHAQKWPIDALNGADLATRLVQFVKNS